MFILGSLLPSNLNLHHRIETSIHKLKVTHMKSLSFEKDLVGVQEELLRFAYKLTTDREEANDLLQETSLKALDNEDKYTPDTNFKGWMYTIMRNIFINNYRKVVRDQTFVDQTDNLYHINLPQDSGFESMESAYDLKEMRRVVNALPKEYRVPFAMHVSGFKYREIAEKLDLPLGTVKSRIFFTRQRLQEELKDFR
jgi:RNA polymerase sigma-70 factor (ECF subfamily)